MAWLQRPAPALNVVVVLSTMLAACVANTKETQNCTADESNFRYVGTDNLILEIDEVSTGATFYLGSRDEDIYLAKDLSEAGIVHWGWFAITEELIGGGEFNRANVSCQGFQITSKSSLVRCQADGHDRPHAYLFERGRGIVKFWWNSNRSSLVSLNGNCGYGYGIG